MKTSVELNANKLRQAMKLSKSKTIRQVLDLALDALISKYRRESMVILLESEFFDDDLNKMRARPKRSGSHCGLKTKYS